MACAFVQRGQGKNNCRAIEGTSERARNDGDRQEDAIYVSLSTVYWYGNDGGNCNVDASMFDRIHCGMSFSWEHGKFSMLSTYRLPNGFLSG